MAKKGRGRPKGSLNKKTIEKQKESMTIDDQMQTVDELLDSLDAGANGIKESDLQTSTQFDESDDLELAKKMETEMQDAVYVDPVQKGSVKEKVLKGPSKPKKWTVSALPRNPSVVEILKGVNSLRGKKDQIAQLSKFKDRKDVIYCLKAAFDPRVVFTLPDGLPDDFTIGDIDTPAGAMDMAPERLIRVYKRMQYWVEGGTGQVKPAKREEIFLDTLRSLEKSEAEFLNAIRNKEMPFKNISKEMCIEAGFDLNPQ